MLLRHSRENLYDTVLGQGNAIVEGQVLGGKELNLKVQYVSVRALRGL